MTYPSGNGASYYKNIMGLVSNGVESWAIFGGTDTNYPPNTFPMALSKIDLSGKVFGDITSVTACRNIASGSLLPNAGVAGISASKVVVSCNPQYGVDAQPIAIVLVEASASGVQTTTIKSASSSSTNQMFEISGASADGSSVFVEEKSYNSTTYATAATKRYWLNLSTKVETEVTTYGGHMFLDTKSGKYVFGCYIENGACKAKTFALVTPGSATPEARTLDFEYDFHGFAERIR